MRHLDLFSGIGGFSYAAHEVWGEEYELVAFCEKDTHAQKVLKNHWPETQIIPDVRLIGGSFEAIDIITGGDPCPSRSLAKGNRKSKHPDLSGYFLAVVGRLRPRWVVRENVFASDACHFAAGLELLGYRVGAFGFDSRDFTGQSRRRQYLIGCPPSMCSGVTRALLDAGDGLGFSASSSEEETPIAACITAHPCRMAAEDSYCFEPGRGLRVLSPEECEVLQGFPRGWTYGLSRSARRRLIGNAITTKVAEFVFRAIHLTLSISGTQKAASADAER